MRSPYVAICSARFRVLLQYRAAALAGLWTQTFFGFTLLMIYEAFYRQGAATPLRFSQVATYVWLAQAMLAMVPWNVDGEIRAMVSSGNVASELCRPVDLYGLWFARALAWRSAPTLLRAVPLTVLAMAVLPWLGLESWRLSPPSWSAALGFAVALPLALLLSCAISTLLHLSLLWTLNGDGLVTIAAAAVSILSGVVVPLPLLPDALRAVLEWLPFAALADLPYRIYAGQLVGAELVSALARQLGWLALAVALGKAVAARGVRRVVVQGG